MYDKARMLESWLQIANEHGHEMFEDAAAAAEIDLESLSHDTVSLMQAMYVGALCSGVEIGLELRQKLMEMKREHN